jgi:hypothetical protein
MIFDFFYVYIIIRPYFISFFFFVYEKLKIFLPVNEYFLNFFRSEKKIFFLKYLN